MRYIAGISGGKDSVAMLLSLRRWGYPIDEAVHISSGSWDYPWLHEHLRMVCKKAHVPLTILNSDIPNLFESGKYTWPSINNRWCTRNKIQTMEDYIKGQGPVTYYVGISFDEIKRAFSTHWEQISYEVEFPLIDRQMTGAEALEYCYKRHITFFRHYDYSPRLGCWCCPFQSIKHLRYTYEQHPRLWKRLQQWDLDTRLQFLTNASIADLTKRFESSQDPPLSSPSDTPYYRKKRCQVPIVA